MAAIKAVTTEQIFPEIIGSIVSEQTLELTLYVAEGLCYFAGHFPEFSILPGVVQLSWAVHYAREFLGCAAPVLNVERLKFTCPIQPNMQVLLRLDVDIKKNSVNFSFNSPPHLSSHTPLIFSQGRLIYGRNDE
jgi:3-hydroxymyristoyl/3-hydroxydecanoyl-(acyl carrier protein) dehydratase